jgi:hypothetical protein
MTTKAEIRAATTVVVAAIDKLKTAVQDYSEDVTDEEGEEIVEFSDNLGDMSANVTTIGEWFADD